MGELRTRKRGKTWEWSFEGAKIEGKRKPISKGGYRTKAEALAAGTQAKAEYDNTGRSFKPSELSVADYLDYWYENYVLIHTKSYNTHSAYAQIIRLHIKPDLGHYRLAALEPDAIQRWIDKKKLDGYAENSIVHFFSLLSGALNYAVYPCKYIAYNSCQYVRIPKVDVSEETKAHTEYICVGEDYKALLERFPFGNKYHFSIITGYNCGTRIGETYGFDLLSDVDFEKHEITINHQLVKEGNFWFYRAPKYNSVRTIKMIPEYEKALKKEIHQRKLNMLRYGEYYTRCYLMPDNSILQARSNVKIPGKEIMPLCVEENGELMNTDTFKYCARIIHYELGNKLFHSHCLRHTHGTILAENGAQPKTVMERLGHKDLKTTMETYVFNTEKMQNDAVDIFVKATS